jgi:hypothetical protein
MAARFFVNKTEWSDSQDASFDYQILTQGGDDAIEVHEYFASFEEAEEICNKWNLEYGTLRSYLDRVSDLLEDAVAYMDLAQNLSLPKGDDLERIRCALIGLKDDAYGA